MLTVLLLLPLLLIVQSVENGVELKSASLSRPDMPEHFPYQLLGEGFAVIQIELQNNSKSDWEFFVDRLEVYSKKGKQLKRALPTDITPKILKYYTGITDYSGHPEARTVREEIYRENTIGVRTPQPMVSLKTVEGIRSVLEEHQVKDIRLEPGEAVEAFYYVKSKDSGNKLSGGWVSLDGKKVEF